MTVNNKQNIKASTFHFQKPAGMLTYADISWKVITVI